MSTNAVKTRWTDRIKLMVRHTWLVVIAVVLLSAGLGAVGFYIYTLPTQLKIAVGPPNSEDVRVVQAIAQQLGRENSGVRLRPLIKEGGTRETGNAIDIGEVDLAVVRRDVSMPKNGQVVAILRKNVALFIVPPSEMPKASRPAKRTGNKSSLAKGKKDEAPAIDKIDDLVGKRLGVIGRSQGNIDLLKAILRQYNISSEKIVILGLDAEAKANAPDKINVVQIETGNVITAIRGSKLDAIFSVGPVSSPITADAIAAATRDKESPTFLSIGAAEAIAERNPIYEATEIKAGAFGGSPPRPEESLETVGVNHYIVARRSLSSDTVANFTKQLFAVRHVLAAEMTSAAKLEAPETDKDASVSVHPGAAAYIDGEMKTFFERYNEWMYLALMVVSFLGSGLAALLSYSKSGDRMQRMKALGELVELTKTARTADTAEDLDKLQAKSDELFSEMVRDVERGSVDETTLGAFSVSFQQVRGAIADRRTALMGDQITSRSRASFSSPQSVPTLVQP